MNRFRLTLANGRAAIIEDATRVFVSVSGALVIYDRENRLTHAIAPGQWHGIEAIADDAPDVYGDATKAAAGA